MSEEDWGPSGPQYLSMLSRPQVRLIREGNYGRGPIDAANVPETCIMIPARTSANNGVPLASWRHCRSLPTLELV